MPCRHPSLLGLMARACLLIACTMGKVYIKPQGTWHAGSLFEASCISCEPEHETLASVSVQQVIRRTVGSVSGAVVEDCRVRPTAADGGVGRVSAAALEVREVQEDRFQLHVGSVRDSSSPLCIVHHDELWIQPYVLKAPS